MSHEDNYWVKRIQGGRFTRRRFVGGAAIAGTGAASFALVGCGDDNGSSTPAAGKTTAASPGASGSPSASATQAAKGKPGGVYRLSSSNGTYDTFDVSRSRFTPFATIMGLTGQRIVQWDSFTKGQLGGGFASKWEQPDPQTLVLTLRPNNFWQNKAPVNGRQTRAEDIVFHIERNKAGKTADGKDDPNFYRKNDYQIVESATVTDPNTVTVKFNKPAPLFLNLLAQSYEVLQAPEAVAQFESLYAQQKAEYIIGTGPYILTQFNPDGHLTYKKNDKFAGTTYLDGRQEVPLFTDQATLQSAFEQKQVDVFAPSTVTQLNDINGRLKGKIQDVPGYSANPIAGTYFGGAAPWNNQNLIGAIFRALDRRQLVQQFHGGRGAISGSIPPTQQAFAIDEKELSTLPGYLEDRAKEVADAKQMWQAGGGPALGEIVLDVPDIFEGVYGASSILTAMLNNNLGTNQFKAKVEPYSTITGKIVAQKYGNGNNNIWYGWITELTDPEPTSFVVGNFTSTSPLNKQYAVKVDGLDDILGKLAVELDANKRKSMTKDAERLIVKAYGAGINYSHVQIVDTLYWNYFHPSENAPFSTAHLITNAWIDKDDPTYPGRPADPSL